MKHLAFFMDCVGKTVLHQKIHEGIPYLHFSDGTMIQVDSSEIFEDDTSLVRLTDKQTNLDITFEIEN